MTSKKESVVISEKGEFIMTGVEDLSQQMVVMAKLELC